jgi:hypothetical protein
MILNRIDDWRKKKIGHNMRTTWLACVSEANGLWAADVSNCHTVTPNIHTSLLKENLPVLRCGIVSDWAILGKGHAMLGYARLDSTVEHYQNGEIREPSTESGACAVGPPEDKADH